MSASLRIPRARLLSASQSKQYIDEYECLGQSALQTRVNLLKNGEAASRIWIEAHRARVCSFVPLVPIFGNRFF